jgi:hypothetical protein
MPLPVITLLLCLYDSTAIGRFELNHQTREWTFKYQKEFPQYNLIPLKEFPDMFQTYGQDVVVPWLVQKSISTSNDKVFEILESIKSHNGKDVFPLKIIIMT